jgi:hypothetical protein
MSAQTETPRRRGRPRKIGTTDAVAREHAVTQSRKTAHRKAVQVDPLPSMKTNPATGDPDYSAAEDEWIKALLAERQRIAPRFLTEIDRLHVLLKLGYHKAAPPDGAIDYEEKQRNERIPRP